MEDKVEEAAFTKFLISNWNESFGDEVIELEGADDAVASTVNPDIEIMDDEDILSDAEKDQLEQLIQMDDKIEQLKYRKASKLKASSGDVFGEFMTEEQREEQLDEVTRRIAEMYAPHEVSEVKEEE